MIHCLLPLLILSADVSAHTASSLAQSQEVRRWDFEAEDDKNYDAWPDDWTRRRGRGYPLYVSVAIVEEDAPRPGSESVAPGNRHALRIDLDGGAALVYSPPIEVNPLFSYALSGHLKTEKLQHHAAYAAVMFYDENRKLLETVESARHRRADRWTRFQVGPVTPASDQARWAVVALHLEPTDKADLFGAALFDDLSFAKLPRLSLEASHPNGLYSDPSEVEITCRLSGIVHPDPRVRFELQDVYGATIATHEAAMQTSQPETVRGRIFAGTATWRPPIRGFGFYRVKAAASDQSGEPIATDLAVLQPFPKRAEGEFGWALPQGDALVPLNGLVSLLGEVGIHWVKFPVWYDAEDMDRANDLAWFAERMSVRKIQMVGLLDQPPLAVRQLYNEQSRVPVASVFLEPEVWRPAVDPLLTRLSLKVHWWQLGADDDTSFVNFPDLEKTLSGIRNDFNRFGQQVHVGISWRSIDESPASKTPPWSFLSYIATPSLTSQEIPSYLPHEPAMLAKRWLVTQPLAKSQYDLESQAGDLVSRMVAAKIQQADAIFVPDPFDPEHGLMNHDRTPGKMLLPWRTAAMLLAGATHAGSIQMPNGSSNEIFIRDEEAVMVVWNDQPVEEVMYLGEQVEQIDVWGNKHRPRDIEKDDLLRQEIRVTRLPTFITGVDPQIARWRIQFQFDGDKIASVFGREQAFRYSFTNPFDQGVGGTVHLHLPDVWGAAQPDATFKLAAQERFERDVRVTLEPLASSGAQPVRIDFDITAARNYKFSIYRTLHVGLGDITVDLRSRLDENGNLIIEQQLTNNTDQFVSFNCNLTTPKRRRERRQIFHLGQGTTTVLFAFPDGEELLGETMWLRVEEIDGARILNHQIIAQE